MKKVKMGLRFSNEWREWRFLDNLHSDDLVYKMELEGHMREKIGYLVQILKRRGQRMSVLRGGKIII